MTDHEPEIILYGTRWCFDSRRSRAVFDKMGVPYTFIDINKNLDGKKFVQQLNHGNLSVPTIVFPDGSILVEPPDDILKEKLTAFIRS